MAIVTLKMKAFMVIVTCDSIRDSTVSKVKIPNANLTITGGGVLYSLFQYSIRQKYK